MTTIYLIRHSQPFRKLLGNYKANETEQLKNEKNILSVLGEELAKDISKKKELQNIDAIFSSNYVRAMSTAKYIAENNKINLDVDERLGERKFGVNSMKELPDNFYRNQSLDWNYKLLNGESLNEVKIRMNDVINEIIIANKNKNIAIVSHGTAITAFLKNLCEIKFNSETGNNEIYFNHKLIFDGNWNCPELFKLKFNNNKLISIENVR